ncbi:MAG: protoporphyrinogen oxidase, partial [Nitriliruptorales bacterium]|nr:protoporphyrinogen oxidase [Nitriliruptorales bacterium]
PAGLGPAGPTRLAPLATSSAVPLLARLRAALEPAFATPVSEDDPAVGPFFRRRFGPVVTDRLIEPLLGGIYTGDIERMSLFSVVPSLEPRLRDGGSLLRGVRSRRRSGSARFVTLPGGLASIPRRLTESLHDVRLGEPVLRVVPDRGGYVVTTPEGELRCSAMVLATPARAAAGLLTAWPGAAEPLSEMPTSPVAVVTFAYPRAAVAGEGGALSGTGVLIPRSTGSYVKAVTFSSTKWTHLADLSHYVLRASVGRGTAGDWWTWTDAQLTEHVQEELRELIGVDATPAEAHVTRWHVPSYQVGHRARVDAAESALRSEQIELAGAPYRGVGIGSCIRQGLRAARRLADRLPSAAGAPR